MNTVSLNTILEEIKTRNPHANFGVVERAWNFAKKAHQGQKRESGDPYVVHPLSTAHTLSQMNLDEATITAALLHDVVDDTAVTIEEIEGEFGKEIAFLVSGVTKLGKIKYRGVERQIENLRKMFLAMAEDIRVVLIKLADRLHNMETISYLPERKQQRIARETLDVYAPLAVRLGMGWLARSLQDLSFPIVYPEEYRWLIANVKEEYLEREKYLRRIEPVVREELQKDNFLPLEINYRAKGYWSLYQKLLKRDMEFSRIHDLIAVRIILKDVKECYGALGVIHNKWRPLPGLIKDYISLPKPNGYQSIHTTVFCEEGKITEFQIRTPEMHRAAEFGIAAHWAYSEKGKPDRGVVSNPRLAWVDQLRNWQKEVTGSGEFLDSLRIDFFKHRIFVLTPKGEVLDLPEDATPIDFAYQIHSEVGNQAVGAKINGKMNALDTPLENGDVVEILIQKNKKPSEKWLEFVQTSNARAKIKQVLRKTPIGRRNTDEREAKLKIYARDRVGLVRDITAVVSNAGINILHVTSEAKSREKPAVVSISLQIKDRTKLTRLITKIKTVPSVEEIEHQFIG